MSHLPVRGTWRSAFSWPYRRRLPIPRAHRSRGICRIGRFDNQLQAVSGAAKVHRCLPQDRRVQCRPMPAAGPSEASVNIACTDARSSRVRAPDSCSAGGRPPNVGFPSIRRSPSCAVPGSSRLRTIALPLGITVEQSGSPIDATVFSPFEPMIPSAGHAIRICDTQSAVSVRDPGGTLSS